MKIVPITSALIDDVVRVHREAFAGYPNTRLGAGYARRFVSWFSTVGDGIALAAIDESGTVLGYVLGARGPYAYPLSRAVRGVAARAILLRPWLAIDRRIVRAVAARVRMWIRPVPVAANVAAVLVPPVASLVAIGTSRASRRGGVASALVEQFEERARALGVKTVRLKVYESNAAARSLYERRGWQPLHTPGADGLTYWKLL